MKLAPRQWLLLAVLSVTLGATLWTAWNGDDTDTVQVATRAPSTSAHQSRPRTSAAAVKAANTATLDIDRLKRSPWQDSDRNLFSGGQAAAQSPSESQPAAQQALEIPPLPFTYAGKLEDHGEYTVFLSMGNKNISVKNGDVVGDWKVKAITPPRMILSYQPLGADVPLMIGESH